MRIGFPSAYILLLGFILIIFSVNQLQAQQKKFVLVLDAGHGGKDPGAVGRISKEKNITLSVAKLVGGMIENNMSDVKVVYTRSADVFPALEERAVVANNNHADLFVSIHVNAAKAKSAYGAETYILGLAKTKANLDVAMVENSVMLLEDDYKTRYKGFDPNSVDSYIMFELMMDRYLDNSLFFATEVQKQLRGYAKRLDRGVRQAGFWVLHRSASPSVLIELGFISNYAEELYLVSDKGQQEIARAIYNAFALYKREHDRKLGYMTKLPQNIPVFESVVDTEEVVKPKVKSTETKPSCVTDNKNPVFKIQIAASSTPIKMGSPLFKGLKGVDSFREAGMYKYTVGADSDFNRINTLRTEIASKFPGAFIIAFVGDKKITANEAKELLKK